MYALLQPFAGRIGGLALLCLLQSLGLNAATAAEFRRGPDLTTPRSGHAAALLQDGRVMVAGGGADTGSTELYDPVRHRWQPGPSLAQAEAGAASLTVLSSGKVLLVGQSRQLFNPSTNTWTSFTQWPLERRRHTATVLASGLVLLAGGERRFGGEMENLELYDPASDSWSAAGRLNQARQAHAAVRLASGKVLIAGGRAGGAELSSAEMFDPQYTYIDPAMTSMLAARSDFSLTLLPDGRVLATGGNSGGTSQNSCEIFDPVSGTWQWSAGMFQPRSGHTASLLPDGRVLVSGGEATPGTAQATAEIYDPATNQWSLAGELAVARSGHAAVLLPTGSVLLLGGNSAAAAVSSEWFDPAITSTQYASLPQTLRRGGIATLLPPDKVLVGGGTGLPGDDGSAAEVFDTVSGTWSWLGLVAGRTRHTQTLLGSGKVLLAGGLYAGAATSHSELADGLTSTSAGAAYMLTPRYAHTATLLADGGVLVAGGYTTGNTPTAAAEHYRSGVDAWTARAALNTPRADHTATLLDDGRVLVSGGRGPGGQLLDSAEIYDPAADSWTTVAAPGIARESASATLLRSGNVFVLGGTDSAGQPLARADLYDPRSNSWRQAAAPARPRVQHTTTLLPGGQILVAGGRTGATGGLRDVEIYTPDFDRWSSAAPLATARAGHAAVPLPSGQILFTHGYADNWSPYLERYDTGLAPDAARQPRLFSASLLTGGHGTLRVGGSGFRPAAGASGSGAGASSNLPVLQVQRVDNGQTRFVPADTARLFTDTLFSGRPAALADFPAGPVQLRAWVNGIPSAALLATLASVPATTTAPVASGGVLRATVTFAASMDDGGAPISGYRVTAVPGGAVRSCLVPCSAVEFEALPPGSYRFHVSAVNAAGAAAPSAPSNSVVVQARSSVALGSSANPSRHATAVTFTATVSGLAPGGTATFQADGNTLCNTVALNAGIATCTTSALGGGLHAIDVSYSGDAGNTAAQSATLYQQVDSAAAQAALSSSANPSSYGERVVLSATVTLSRLAGHVDFHDGAAPLCLDVQLSDGAALCEVENFSVGTHAITARYSGDGDTGAAVSFALAQQVLALPTTTSVATSCQRRFTANEPFTLSAAISVQALGGTPGGSVDFVTGSGVTLCQAVPLDAASARCTSTGLAAPVGQGQGVVAITARYSGDAINAGGSSQELEVIVFDAADVVLRSGFDATPAGCPGR